MISEYKEFNICGIKIKLKRKSFWRGIRTFYRKITTMPVYNRVLNNNPQIDKRVPVDFKGAAKFPHGGFDLGLVLKNINFVPVEDKTTPLDYVLTWGMGFGPVQRSLLKDALKFKARVNILENGFIRSAYTYEGPSCMNAKYLQGISCVFDDMTAYFDATRPSRLECMLNDPALKITAEQKQRARALIKKIADNNLTKYNHQPIYTPQIGRPGAKKILLVDQAYGDMSVSKGLANDKTFEIMFQKAVEDNPGADIIVKTHPDTAAGIALCYYSKVKQENNIYLMREPINPLSLTKYVDKVYVCTTQLGLEALLCGKEVHTFGMPFYGGWGLTKDYLKCERRTNKRTLEELFYITYILYTRYINPAKRAACEIEEAIDYLLDLRKEYFKEFKIRHDL